MRTFLLSVTAMCIVVVAIGCQPAKKQEEPKDQPAKTGSDTKEKAAETLGLEPPASPVEKPAAPTEKPVEPEKPAEIKLLPITPPEMPAAKTPEPAANPAPVPSGSNGKAD